MDKYVPKENVPSNSYGGDIGSKYGRGGFNSGSNYGKPISFDSGHSNQNEFKKDTFKVNKDFDFDSLLDEPQDSKGKFNNDLDFDTNKMSQMSMKPIINSNNSRRMRSARKFLEENNDMDFTSQKNMSVNPSMGSGSNYHFGGNSGGSSFQPSFNQPSMGRRGNDNMMIGDSNYGIGRTEDKPNGNSVLFGMASRRRK